MATAIGCSDGEGRPLDQFTVIYLAHRQQLVAYLTAFTRDHALAEDLAHDAFARLLAAGEERAELPAEPGAWLFTVARNLAVSHARHRRAGTRVTARLAVPDPARSAEDVALLRHTGRIALAALADLAPDARIAVVMAATGYSGCEASARLGRTPLATRALACRARRRLRTAAIRAEG